MPPGLSSLLELEELGVDRFSTAHEPEASSRRSLFGGLVLAQALRAAGMTVTDDRVPHSLHGYFLRPGRVDQPVVMQVDRDRDGRSFSMRHVRAMQDDRAIFSMTTSFHTPRIGGEYDALPVRPITDPEDLPSRASQLLVEIREVNSTRVGDGHLHHSDRLWVRAPAGLADDPLTQACAVAYVSDLGSGFGQAEIEEVGVDGPSIDHSIWFHSPIRADDWMLLDLWPLKAGGTRGMYQGSVRNGAGTLGAVISQEMLLRERPLPPEVLEQMAEFLGVIDPGQRS